MLTHEKKNTNAKVKSILELFYKWEKSTPNTVYLRQPIRGQWIEYTWREVGNQARKMATALQNMGVTKGTPVGLVSKNSAHWIMCDLAILMAGGVSVPFYPTLDAEKIKQVLDLSGAKILFVGKLDDWKSMKDGIGKDITCIAFPESPSENEAGFLKWNELCAKNPAKVDNYMPHIDDLCTIIYTSGTTGVPKGVMHSYYTMMSPVDSSYSVLHVGSDGSNRFISYLPLCHIAERSVVESASIFSGGTVYFVESLDTFKDNLAYTRPTHFLAVPRIWTKFQQGILEKLPQKRLNFLLKIPIISGIIKNKIKKGLGLDKAKVCITGAAPMPISTIEWFKKIGINIQDAYGMTENTGCCSVAREQNILKQGTQNLPDCEIKIDPSTQEVLMKSDWIMLGYYNEPTITANTIKDGWLHTGDMGEYKDGTLRITGRVKDQFKTSKGEFVVPVPIESKISENTLIEQVCLVGRGLAQPVALVVLSEIGKKSPKEQVENSFKETLKSVNVQVQNWEKVDKFIISKNAWTIENGILTPTLKIKRNVLEDVFGSRLEKWASEKELVIWE